MLLNLLPGFREVRAPLAAGFLWLLFGWLVLPDSFSLPAEFEDFAHEFSQVGTAAALSLGAYVVGSLLTEVLAPAWRLTLRLREFVSLSLWIRHLDRAGDRPRKEKSKAIRADVERGASEGGVDASDDLGESGGDQDAWARATVALLALGSDSELLSDRGRFALGGASEPLSHRGRLAIIELFAPGERREWSDLAVMTVMGQVRSAVRELNIARFRLLSEERDLFNEVDRLRGEGLFRLAVAPPLVAVTIALWITDYWLWVVALPAIGLLAWQGLDKLEESGDRVADALRARKVTIPYLEGAHPDAPSDQKPCSGGEKSSETDPVAR